MNKENNKNEQTKSVVKHIHTSIAYIPIIIIINYSSQ